MNLFFLIDFFFKTFLQVNSSPVNRNLAQQRFSQHVHQWPGQRVHRSGESANMFTRDSTNTFYQHIYQANMFTSDFVSMFSSVTLFISDLGNIFTSHSTNFFTSILGNIFTSDLANNFTSDSDNIFISDSVNIFTSYLRNMFTSDSANMFTSDLASKFVVARPTCLQVTPQTYSPGVWQTCSPVT